MIRKSFALQALLYVSVFIELFLIVDLFIKDKNWSSFIIAIVGFALLPISCSLLVWTSKLQPSTRVIVITGVWVAWVALAGISGLAYYTYWLNGGTGTPGIETLQQGNNIPL